MPRSASAGGTARRLVTAIAWVVAAVGIAAAEPGPAGSLADRLKAVQSGDADSGVRLPTWKPVGPGTTNPPLPMAAGLVVVTAINQPPLGDYESIKTLVGVQGATVLMHYSANRPKPKLTGALKVPTDLALGNADPSLEFPDKVECARQIDAADLATAHAYSEMFCQASVEHFPGTTSISTSAEVLAQLRAGKSVDFHFASADKWAVFAQQGALAQGTKPVGALLTTVGGQWMYACRLERVGTTDVAFPVLLNNQPVELPALHAACTLEDGEHIHFYWLDQSINPITLAFQIDHMLLQAIRIVAPATDQKAAPGPTPPGLERALGDKRAVPVYGIYFDFNSATIKPESQRVLQEIAGILMRNPDWKLSLSGHTDNIGNDQANLTLSQRRTAAVKAALVKDYHVDADRLVTGGYGSSRPIAPNDSLEGRARNRRVELQRV